jgi:hypothetical protein
VGSLFAAGIRMIESGWVEEGSVGWLEIEDSMHDFSDHSRVLCLTFLVDLKLHR